MTVLQHASGRVWYLQHSGYLALSCRDCHLLLFCWHSPCSHSLPSSFGACLPCPVPHAVKKTGLFLPLTHKIALWTRYHAKVNLLVFCTTKKKSATAGKVTYTLRRGFGQGFFFLKHVGIHTVSSTKNCTTDCRYEPAMKTRKTCKSNNWSILFHFYIHQYFSSLTKWSLT